MPTKPGTYAKFKTSEGTVVCELFEKDAPQTVANFIGLAEGTKDWNSRSKKGAKLYDGTIFHRVIGNFMIQGGGFQPGMKEKPKTRAPIKNEAANGLSNSRGTMAMARTNVPDSATSQFYINLRDNAALDKQFDPQHVGYCVFGRVIDGMDVVDKIGEVETTTKRSRTGMMADVPSQAVVIKSIRRVDKD